MPDKKSPEELTAENPEKEIDESAAEPDETVSDVTDTPPEDSDIEDALILEEKVADEDEAAGSSEDADEADPTDADADEEETVEPEPLIWDASETESKSEPEPVPAAVVPPPEPQRSGMGPVLGGLLAAAIGFGGAWFLSSQGYLGGAPEVDPAAEAALVAEIEERMAALSEAEQKAAAERISALEAQIAELAGAAATPAEPDARVDNLLAAVSGLEAAVRSQGSALDGLQSDIETIATLPAAGGDEEQAEAMASLREALKLQRTENARIQSEVEKMTAETMSEVEAAKSEAAALKAEAEALRAESQQAMQDAAEGAAIARLEAALESGAAFEALLPDLSAAGIDVDPALEAAAATGVPTLPALQGSFPQAARQALAAARKGAEKSKPAERLTLFLKTHLGARSLEAREGDSADAVLSRAEAAVREGDLASALTEISALPQSGQDAMADWTGAARARQDATAAAEALVAKLNTN